VGHATQGDTEYVANSGIHAAETRVYIEDQPNLDGFAGFFGANGDFGTTHSITLLVDSLALQELFQTLSPALERTQIEAIFAASSNDMATGTTVGLSGSAEARPLENALDALRRLFLPEPVTKTAADPSTGGFGNLANRNKFYEGIAAVKTAVAGASLTIEPFVELVSIAHELRPTIRFTPNEVIAEAEEATDRGLAFRYALKALNPFAVIGADYPGLGHTANGQLALFDPATGLGEMTPEYLLDRAAFLEAKMELSLVNEKTSGDTIHYQDYATGFEITTGSIFSIDQEFLFGSEQADTLVGNSEEDHLYGGASADLLIGSGGNDYLQGDTGNDRLDGGTGSDTLNGGLGRDLYVLNPDGIDTIEDSDHRGALYVNEQLMVGGLRRPGDAPDAPYTSLDGQWTFVETSGNLVINDHVTITNWQPGDLGIRLRDLSSLPDGIPPVINYANGQPTITYDGDATDNQPIFMAAANHIARGFGGNDILSFEGGSALYNHQIFGGEGHDELRGGAGQDRIYGETGRDLMLGLEGDDVLDGGAEIDLLKGGSGRDTLYGGPGNDGLDGGSGDDVLLGGADDDVLSGEAMGEAATTIGNDFLNGEAGADWLLGLRGDDVLKGGDQNDRLYGDQAPTEVPNLRLTYPGLVTYDPHPGFASRTGGNDYLDGGAGDDYLQGDAGDDVLVGGMENDTLYGDDQTIDGVEPGKDLLDGGAGDDRLVSREENDERDGKCLVEVL
jgi:Ca2+-binding RTX toxin-like protein